MLFNYIVNMISLYENWKNNLTVHGKSGTAVGCILSSKQDKRYVIGSNRQRTLFQMKNVAKEFIIYSSQNIGKSSLIRPNNSNSNAIQDQSNLFFILNIYNFHVWYMISGFLPNVYHRK